ncbi:hypothetical protein [Alkalibacillus haloalkaliphilus]|uniref:hypothetical protein n=1 Tax=Alkalibacillus haloalkaliphilus TaxID=94136 RepID=UPI00293575D7|nr:hypothetical protein [Alkalibacillus haloalkaliphilus]MDV2582944.1 hypothetical protein [Alkalibacillus haloalkaliphilus]
MTVIGWLALVVLLLVIFSVTTTLFIRPPHNPTLIHALSITPLIAGVLFAFTLPNSLIFIDESVASFVNIIVPLGCIIAAFPLVIRANRVKRAI